MKIRKIGQGLSLRCISDSWSAPLSPGSPKGKIDLFRNSCSSQETCEAKTTVVISALLKSFERTKVVLAWDLS